MFACGHIPKLNKQIQMYKNVVLCPDPTPEKWEETLVFARVGEGLVTRLIQTYTHTLQICTRADAFLHTRHPTSCLSQQLWADHQWQAACGSYKVIYTHWVEVKVVHK